MQFQNQWQQDEWIKCARSFEYFAANYIEIRSLEKGAVKFQLYEYQKRVLKEFAENRFNIVRKFRQGGLTTLAVLWSLWMCTFRENKQILVMSKTDLEAIKAGKIAKRAIDVLTHSFPWLAPRLSQDSKHVLTFLDTKSELEFGSTNRARGQALNYVIIDEAAFIPNMEETWADMYPTVSTGGNVIIISTVNGMGNWYQKMYYEAEAGLNGFHVIDLHYTEHPSYSSPEWAAQTRANLGDRLFAQEIEGSFLGSGESYIPIKVLNEYEREVKNKYVIKRLFPEWTSETKLQEHANHDSEGGKWDKGALWIWHEPRPGHEYIIGVDVAEGVGADGDSSTFQVFDCSTLEQVAEFSSNTVPPNTLAMIVARIGIHYNTALIVVENAGPGLAILDKLEHNLYYENLYYQRTRTQERAGMTMTRSTRPVILEAMQNYMQSRTVKLSSPRLIRELYTFIFDRSKKRAEAQKGEHDDLVMAFAITLYTRDRYMRDTSLNFETASAMPDIQSNRTYEEIRKQIEESATDDLLSGYTNVSDPLANELDEILPGFKMPFDRPNDDLFREFGF